MVENTDKIRELVSMCSELIVMNTPISSDRRRLQTPCGLEICISPPLLLSVHSNGELVLHKYLISEDVITYLRELEGWEKRLKELYIFLILREAEVDGYVINL